MHIANSVVNVGQQDVQTQGNPAAPGNVSGEAGAPPATAAPTSLADIPFEDVPAPGAGPPMNLPGPVPEAPPPAPVMGPEPSVPEGATAGPLPSGLPASPQGALGMAAAAAPPDLGMPPDLGPPPDLGGGAAAEAPLGPTFNPQSGTYQ